MLLSIINRPFYDAKKSAILMVSTNMFDMFMMLINNDPTFYDPRGEDE